MQYFVIVSSISPKTDVIPLCSQSILEDQYQQGIDLVRANRGGRMRRGDNQDIPDTLYMVEERPRTQEHLREPSSVSDLSNLPPGER